MLITDPNLELLPWTTTISASVNPVLADAMIEELNQADAAAEVDMIATKPYGGGLVGLSRPVPLVDGLPLPYLGVDWQIKPSNESVAQGRVAETDAIVIFPPDPTSSPTIQNHYDGSCQRNIAEGGMMQIDNATANWTDTGYKPGPLPADVFTFQKVRYKFDFVNKLSSVLSIASGADPMFAVPASLQNIAAGQSNWSRTANGVLVPLLKLQYQRVINTVPAGFKDEFRCTVYWSDQPIP